MEKNNHYHTRVKQKVILFVLIGLLCVPVLVSAQNSPLPQGPYVDLLWEAQTHLPPFFSGHSQASSESVVRAVAIAFLPSVQDRLPHEDLFFSWYHNNQLVSPASGYGQDQYSFVAAHKGGETTVAVSVSTRNKSYTATKKIVIPTVAPIVSLYAYDPLRGPSYERALNKEVTVVGREISIKAEPYYMSKERFSDINFEWVRGNTSLIPTNPDRSIITFGVREGVRGTFDVRVKATHAFNLLQEASGLLRLSFDQEPLRF